MNTHILHKVRTGNVSWRGYCRAEGCLWECATGDPKSINEAWETDHPGFAVSSYRPSAPVKLILAELGGQFPGSGYTRGLILAASLIMAMETNAPVELCGTWVVEEIQERMANRG